MRLYVVAIEFRDVCVYDHRVFTTEDKADAFLAALARDMADERGEDFEPGEWREYLADLEERRDIEWSEGWATLDAGEVD